MNLDPIEIFAFSIIFLAILILIFISKTIIKENQKGGKKPNLNSQIEDLFEDIKDSNKNTKMFNPKKEIGFNIKISSGEKG